MELSQGEVKEGFLEQVVGKSRPVTKKGSLAWGHVSESNSTYTALRGGNKGVTQEGKGQITEGTEGTEGLCILFKV